MSRTSNQRLIEVAARAYLVAALGLYALPFVLSGAFFARILSKIVTSAL
jgi:hypothetical protein